MPRSGCSVFHGMNPNLKKKRFFKHVWPFYIMHERVKGGKNILRDQSFKEGYPDLGGQSK